MTALIETCSLSAGYGRDKVIVRDLNIEVGLGEVVALLGPNGAGKTTTVLTLAGELAPLGGEVRFDGDATAAPLYRRARSGMALVTEERAVLMTMTVAQNLKVSRCDLNTTLQQFPELEAHLSRRVGLLSGGQQQMLALARALGRPTRLLLADELSLGLAPIIVTRLLKAVRTAAAGGMGVLLVEQHVHQALRYADRVYVMRRGRIEMSGTADEIRNQLSAVEASYLQV
jgi:branched-chain amino acid transport system ATP-binding protein